MAPDVPVGDWSELVPSVYDAGEMVGYFARASSTSACLAGEDACLAQSISPLR